MWLGKCLQAHQGSGPQPGSRRAHANSLARLHNDTAVLSNASALPPDRSMFTEHLRLCPLEVLGWTRKSDPQCKHIAKTGGSGVQWDGACGQAGGVRAKLDSGWVSPWPPVTALPPAPKSKE